ncbi:MAG: T9SS type A sorting domain-containing protein [Ignavibacteriaceae bacterium]|nr:T9SS type A sorting domain-containing protein [Ignavibacteriaceae bacterium]
MNYLKKFFVIFTICVVFPFAGKSQDFEWIKINHPFTFNIYTMVFVDSLTGWAAGDSGKVIKTTDGGSNWELKETGVNSFIQKMYFLDHNFGWAVTLELENEPFGTIILKTADGGDTWEKIRYRQEFVFMNAIKFRDSLNGVIGSLDGIFAHTNDGGENWVEAPVDSAFFSNLPVVDFLYFDDDTLFACGGAFDVVGIIWKSTNGGSSWRAYGVGPEPIQQMAFDSNFTIFGVGGDFEYGTGFVRSEDFGESWYYESLELFGVAYALSFRTEDEMWAPLGTTEKLMYSTNKGNDWVEFFLSDSAWNVTLVFTDSLTGFTAGYFGNIYKYNRILTSVEEKNISIQGYKLDNPYPNPLSYSSGKTTKVNLILPVSSAVYYKLYDINGRLVKKIIEPVLQPGEYLHDFSLDALASGVYILTVEAISSEGNQVFRDAKKINLIK